MAGLISQYQQGAFTSPVNATVADATVVLSNDNATRAKHNSHDGDATIHVQSSTLASRPAAATAQRFWVTTDGLRAYLDTGAVWSELAYLPLAVGGSVGGNITITSGGLTVSSGTSALQAVTCTTLNASGLITAGAAVTVSSGNLTLTSGSIILSTAGRYLVGSTGAALIGYNAGTTKVDIDANAIGATFGAGVTIANGLTVTAGTSALQAVTATTGVFIGDIGLTGSRSVTASNALSLACLSGTGQAAMGGAVHTQLCYGAGFSTSLDINANGAWTISAAVSGTTVTINGGGLTVSAGTSALQALTATTVTGTGLFLTPASATGSAGLRLPHGAAPTSPTDGDMWTTTAGLFVRINGVTKTVTLT